MAIASGYRPVVASGVLTFTGNAVDTQTVVIAGKTYTFQDSLTDVDGNVHVGADAAGSIKNLAAAINMDNNGETGTTGVDYAASMSGQNYVQAFVTATTLTLKAEAPGSIGNLVTTTETLANASWGAATLENGTGTVDAWLVNLMRMNQINAEVLYEIKALTLAAD